MRNLKNLANDSRKSFIPSGNYIYNSSKGANYSRIDRPPSGTVNRDKSKSSLNKTNSRTDILSNIENKQNDSKINQYSNFNILNNINTNTNTNTRIENNEKYLEKEKLENSEKTTYNISSKYNIPYQSNNSSTKSYLENYGNKSKNDIMNKNRNELSKNTTAIAINKDDRNEDKDMLTLNKAKSYNKPQTSNYSTSNNTKSNSSNKLYIQKTYSENYKTNNETEDNNQNENENEYTQISLSNRKINSEKERSITPNLISSFKASERLVGLDNLGNTCFMYILYIIIIMLIGTQAYNASSILLILSML